MIRPIYILTLLEIADHDPYFQREMGSNWGECYRKACNSLQSDNANLFEEEGITDSEGMYFGETSKSDENFYRKKLTEVHDFLESGGSSYYIQEHLFGVELDGGSLVESGDIPENSEQYINSLEEPCKEQDG